MSKTEFARELRHRQTDAERKLWSRLRNREIDNWKFKRQVPFGPYVLDFFCFEAALVIEVDGGQHAQDRAEPDRRRLIIWNTMDSRSCVFGTPTCCARWMVSSKRYMRPWGKNRPPHPAR